jgi:uncharacterized protein (TIGR00299 family) protein
MPKRILFYDCSAGISGDMHLAAMVDLGVPPEHLTAELGKLGLAGWRLHFTRDSRKGIGGTRCDVLLDGEAAPTAPGHAELQPRPATTIFKPVTKLSTPLAPGLAGPHEHRNHRDIVAMIECSTLAAGVKRRALAIFGRIAEAEAKIHGVPVAEVGFHEVGAVDSIIDIVGAAVALEWLRPDSILVSTIELGGGFVRCAHGRLPVPAPATADLLRGAPVRLGTVPFEAATPTGAAILVASADGFTDKPDFTIERIGYGIGHKDGPIPNILRVFLATERTAQDAAPATGPQAETVVSAPRESAVVLECNLDDMTGETAGFVLEKLLCAGASDAWITPIVMKKSRPAITLSVLCPPGRESALTGLLLRETTTFGLRRREVGKLALERTFEEVATSLGSVRVKTAWLDGRRMKSKPEHDDLRRLATERDLPLREVERTVLAELAQREAKSASA